MIALQEAYKAGLLTKSHWIPNLSSGLIVGIVALPLAMAFAIASGARPEQGLYTAIIAGLLVSLFGGSRVQIAGPTGAFIVILSGITAQYGIAGLQLATIFAGFILLLMGLTRLGRLVKLIPEPVIIGFTTGIAFIIFIGEWKDFFGFQGVPPTRLFHEKLFFLIKAFPHLNLATTSLSLLSLLLVVLSSKIFKKIPGPLLAMVLVTLLQIFFQFPGVATIGSTFGGIPQRLPQFQLPDFSGLEWFELIGPALSIAFLGALESLLSAVVADKMAGTRHHSNQELIGQGLANIIAPLFGGFAATGAIARTATNIKNGGNSPLAGIIHSLTLILIIVLFAPLATFIPLAVLAAILFVVAYNMSDLRYFIYLLKYATWKEALVLLTTFFLTLFADLALAVSAGVVLSLILKLQEKQIEG